VTLPELLGIEFDDVRPDRVVARLRVRPELLAPNDYLHAATVVALADTACGCGTLAGAPDFTTIELKANFLATVLDGELVCTAERRHGGRTTQVWDAEVTCDGRVLALFRCTQLIL
jgi:1,4-dihydroxy-2-naphthoyl-CoA hydrolase